MQHFATAVSCGVEDIGKQPLQHLSAQNDLGVNRNNNCGRRREYGAAASGLCSLMSRVLPLAGPITCLARQVFGPAHSCVYLPCVCFYVNRRNLPFGRWVLTSSTCNIPFACGLQCAAAPVNRQLPYSDRTEAVATQRVTFHEPCRLHIQQEGKPQ